MGVVVENKLSLDPKLAVDCALLIFSLGGVDKNGLLTLLFEVEDPVDGDCTFA